jgi:hypothetical protein
MTMIYFHKPVRSISRPLSQAACLLAGFSTNPWAQSL